MFASLSHAGARLGAALFLVISVAACSSGNDPSTAASGASAGAASASAAGEPGDAAVLRYEWTVAGEDGSSTDVAVTQYALVANGSGYTLTFSAPAETLAEYGPIFDQIAESFEAG